MLSLITGLVWQGQEEAGSEEQAHDVAQDDPDAEHNMVHGVLASLLKDDADEDDLPQVL